MGQVPAGLECTRAIFQDVLARAKIRGELVSGANVAALARFMTSSIQGMRLVGKVNPDRAALEDIAKTILQCLGQQPLLRVCTENLIADIVVVKAAKDRKRTDDAGALQRPRERRIFV